jgi:hypothetical protein
MIAINIEIPGKKDNVTSCSPMLHLLLFNLSPRFGRRPEAINDSISGAKLQYHHRGKGIESPDQAETCLIPLITPVPSVRNT